MKRIIASKSKNNKNGVVGLVILIVVAIILAATNPSEQKFQKYIGDRVKKEAKKEDAFSGAIMELFAGPGSVIAALSADRKNYILFSTYSFSVLDEKVRYIGLFNTFIKL